jgi:hypothetical protein
MYQKIPDVARPTLTSTNQEVLTASGDKLKILGRGNFLMRLDDTKDMVALLSGLALPRPRPTFSLFLSVCEFSS